MHELLGTSSAIQVLRRLIGHYAQWSFPVLILGETGTGKELVARCIHEASARGPFVPIDCAALTSTLVESDLFGYVKGAFTGADHDTPGLLHAANGGTVLFDEIGDLPPRAQGRLLRVLQERQVRPVGGRKWEDIDIRVLAATSRNLAAAVKAKTFREDLYHRLNVLSVIVPPLRERKEDIPLLARHAAAQFGATLHFPQHILDRWMRQNWPGNVRELQNCVARMVAGNSTSDSLVIPPAWCGPDGIPGVRKPVRPMAEIVKEAILNAMIQARGDKLLAAKLLRIGKTTLYRKLKLYGVEGI